MLHRISPNFNFSPHCAGTIPVANIEYKGQSCPVHRLDYASLQYMYAMIFTLEEINQSETLLPGVKLGHRIFNTCSRPPWAPQAALSLAGGHSATCNYTIGSTGGGSSDRISPYTAHEAKCCDSGNITLYFCLHVSRQSPSPSYYRSGFILNNCDAVNNPWASLCAVSE